MTFAVSRAFIVDLDKQPTDTDSSQASGLASRFKESMNVNSGTGRCIGLFVFYNG